MERSTCAPYEPGLVPWAEDETLPDDVARADFETHLASCRRCRASVAAYRAVLGEMGREAPSAKSAPRLMAPTVRSPWWNPLTALWSRVRGLVSLRRHSD